MDVVTFDARANPVIIVEQSLNHRTPDGLNAGADLVKSVRHKQVSPSVQVLSRRVQAMPMRVSDLGDA